LFKICKLQIWQNAHGSGNNLLDSLPNRIQYESEATTAGISPSLTNAANPRLCKTERKPDLQSGPVHFNPILCGNLPELKLERVDELFANIVVA
jgi:hypothetical protein